ncbi:MAG: hypothetical protein ABID63_04240 [Pseudomonadota bacterium]
MQAASNCVIDQGFATYDRQYRDTARKYRKALRSLAGSLRKLSSFRKTSLLASQQLYIYAKWLARYTAYWPELDAMVARLEDSFDHHDQSYVGRQSPDDGSWGWHYQEFHHKFDATIVRLHELAAARRAPRYALDFLEPVSTPQKMRDYLEHLRISDIATTGRNQRDEYGGVLTCLAQLCFKPTLRAYAERHVRGIKLDQAYVDCLADFLDESQNPETGYWGPWYQADGQIHRYDDLSYTFHIVSYRKGDVKRWPEIIRTTFANRTAEYPLGWLANGEQNNHNNYDVAKIFRFGWPHMSSEQRQQASQEIACMLEWCLRFAMDEEGRFVCEGGFYNSPAACSYFGVSFLDEVGYFDEGKRFWTQRTFPGSARDAMRIHHHLAAMDPKDPGVMAAKWKLGHGAGTTEPCPPQTVLRVRNHHQNAHRIIAL